MKIKKIIIILFLLVFIAGCGSRGTKPNLEDDVYRGTEALELLFLKDVPPVQTFAQTGDSFEVALEMKNQGTFPLSGKLYLSGFDPNIIRFSQLDIDQGFNYPSPNCGFTEILPRSKLNPPGGTCIEELRGQLNLDSITDSYTTNIFAQSVYRYITDANIVLCIDPDVYGITASQKACVMTPYSSGGGQGAPVGVTKIEPTAIGGGKILYRIYIANLGDGEVVDYSKAPYELKPSDIGHVRYRIGSPSTASGISISVGGNSGSGTVIIGNSVRDITGKAVGFSYRDNDFSIKFNPQSDYSYSENLVRLHDGKAVITQVVDYSGNAYAFQTPLQITLEYGYMESAQQRVEIVNINQYRSELGAGGVRFVYDKNGKRVELNEDGSVRYKDKNFQVNLPIDVTGALFGRNCRVDADCEKATSGPRCIGGKCRDI